MDLVSIAGLAIVLIVVVAILLRRKKEPKSVRLFRQQDSLFTPAERSFLGVLDQASAGRYRVFGKVRIADVVLPVKGLDKSTWTKVFNRIKAKHFDFVLCDPQTLAIKAVIELNDKSHTSRRRIDRDELVRRACTDAGLALRMVKAQRNYSLEAVKTLLNEVETELQAEPDDEQRRVNGLKMPESL